MIRDLSDKAMVTGLNISQWTARRYDKEVSDKVASDFNAERDSGRYHKLLIAQDAIKKISRIAGDARTFHYANTVAWGDDNSRLLPAANYFPYTAKMREYKAQFDAAVSEFVGAYPSLVEEAKNRLNGMFKQRDYPSPHAIAGKYGFSVTIDPLMTASDFRVTLGAEEIKAIQADIESRMLEQQQRATRELWDRLYETVKHMTEKLSDSDAIFRDSLTGNIAELCDLLPKLNVMEDSQLDTLTKEIQTKLLKSAPEVLREDKQERQTVASEAANILATMSAYMGK